MGASERDNVVSVGPGGNLDLDNIFSYHAPTPEQVTLYEAIRTTGGTLAQLIAQVCPAGPERSTAINKVREAVMWSNASIACYKPGWPPAEPDEESTGE